MRVRTVLRAAVAVLLVLGALLFLAWCVLDNVSRQYLRLQPGCSVVCTNPDATTEEIHVESAWTLVRVSRHDGLGFRAFHAPACLGIRSVQNQVLHGLSDGWHVETPDGRAEVPFGFGANGMVWVGWGAALQHVYGFSCPQVPSDASWPAWSLSVRPWPSWNLSETPRRTRTVS